MIDDKYTKPIWFVYRRNRGCWQEIYHTPDEGKAYAEADKMQTWDCPAKVICKQITFIRSK